MSNKLEKENSEFLKFVKQTAHDAYIFGYPLVLMDVTKWSQMYSGVHINTFVSEKNFPDPSFKNVVSPNVDTLYTNAWLDLSCGPIILNVPQITKRYYVMELLDAWTNVFASIGTRTTGIGSGDFGIIGPNWNESYQETLPAFREHSVVREYRSPTNMAWIIGRIHADYETKRHLVVNEYQNQFKLKPLKNPPTCKKDYDNKPKHSPPEIVAKLDTQEFFNRLNMLMADNPPAPDDAIAMMRFKEIGIIPGIPFNLDNFPREVKKAIECGVKEASDEICDFNLIPTKKPAKQTNFWSLPLENVGRYGTEYLQRAIVAYLLLGGNLPEDAVYANTRYDSEGEILNGKNKYTIRFPKEKLPPVKAFWSLTMYNLKQQFVPNEINRYALGSRDIENVKPEDKLQFNKDGSLTMYLQH
ncbi:DUF1254 domain-containing protein [Gigaspora margarita]|uniref:DUF1254 domain-containing protein n=1 Tax=Gigaspora margarita TaxID=4874 RepID=A0A8H3XHB7_GIGMA|nr:DUF1254 domain-containing protein [Gigaspora margarita]